MDKTLKTFAYSEDDNCSSQQTNVADDKINSHELAMKDAQLEEERSRSLEHLKTTVHLRECLKQEQEKNAEFVKKLSDLQNQLNKLVAVEENELFKKNAQLEDEKKKSGEYLKTINVLMESLKLEQEKSAEMEKKITFQETKAKELALEYLNRVHISDPNKTFYDYPHQISGGTKQRIGIAMALVNSPELLILDEPTTALDVTIQSQILDLLDEIIEREKLSILFISHDFGIIARMCDAVGVMRKGKIVERGDKNQILKSPKEPYTISLLESVKALT